MKKLNLNKLILVGLLIITPCLMGSGCGSTPIATINNSNALLITSVNAGMTTWAAYVAGGNATQKQVDTVKAAYNTYYNAELILKGALEVAINSTNSVTSTTDLAELTKSTKDAEDALLALLNQYLLKK